MDDRGSIDYVGRFAPSPTGPLHFGSLVAAVASYLQARVNDGRWLLRIEDIDPPREQMGATDAILRSLERYRFEWDGDTVFQSCSEAAHESALAMLLEGGRAYPCGCSRRDLAESPRGPMGIIYPGTCRNSLKFSDAAIRVRTDNCRIEFEDAVQGLISQRLESESGDFVIQRRDKRIAYQLAVVVDDHLQGVTEIVRGNDLLDSTPRQIWLQKLLGFHTPRYAHIPVITHKNGDKLSKLTGAPGIPEDSAGTVLREALAVLRQDPPTDLGSEDLDHIWSWATENWQLGQVVGIESIVKTS